MITSRSARFACLLLLTASSVSLSGASDWRQWGGPGRDFVIESDPGLAASWPEEGPEVLWRRPLGDNGHSGVVVDGGTFYTLIRRGDRDALLAADVATGETVWETGYEAPLFEGYNLQFGPGPHATPLLAGGRVFTASTGAVITAFDQQSGEIAWQFDLLDQLEVTPMHRGYGASPIAWNDLVIVNGGGQGQGMIALRQSDGEVVWKSLDGSPSYSSPLLLEIDGVTQLVVALGAQRAGLDPSTGEVLWTLDLPQTAETTMSTQLQVGPHQIFTSSAYADGSRLYEVHRNGEAWVAEEVWYTRKQRVQHMTTAQFGDYVYGSSGDFGPAFLTAVRIADGELGFRQRGFAKANLLRVGERVLILDEDGVLALGDPSPDGIEILARADVLDGVSWTTPTLIGTTLLVRNREEMVALDLGSSSDTVPTPATATASADTGETEASLGAVPPRTDTANTLVIADDQLEMGLPYYVMPGDDTQLVITSDALLQRVSFTTSRAVGYLVAPFDLEQLDSGQAPVVAGALRIPLPSLQGGDQGVRGLLLGPRGLDAGSHPEIGVVLKNVSGAERVDDGDDPDRATYRFEATLALHVGDQVVDVETPVELSLQRSTQAAMARFVGDLAMVRASFPLELASLGVEIPPPMTPVIASTLDVDLFLAFSTVTPDKTLNPAVSAERYAAESRFLVLARDLGDDVAGYRHARSYLREIWDDADALSRLAFLVIAEPGLERRHLGFGLQAAERANELRAGEDPLLLNTVARYRFERGDTELAVEIQERALALLGEEDGGARSALEENLARYRAALE